MAWSLILALSLHSQVVLGKDDASKDTFIYAEQCV